MAKRRSDRPTPIETRDAAASSADNAANRANTSARVADEDALAFRAAVADATPLTHVPRAAPIGGGRRAQPRRPRAAESAHDLDADMPLIAAADDGSAVLSFRRSGVRLQEMRKLRRGLYPQEDELDLHGLTQSAARDHLAHFIIASREAGHRCVRIIHGKGHRSGGRGAVLKTAVDMWLRRHLDVLAFASAKTIDGGTGALYVMLRI